MTLGATPVAARFAGALLVATVALTACAGDDGDGERASDEPVGARRATDDDVEVEPEPTTTTAVPPGGRQPDADDPLRVLFAGDSIGIEVAAPAMAALGGGGATVNYFVANPSLPRDAARNGLWEQRLADGDPDVVVLLVGVWERMVFGQGQVDGQTVTQYRTDVIDPFVDLVTSQGAELVWVSSPLVQDATVSSQIGYMDEAFRGVGESDDRVDFIDVADRVAGPDGAYLDRVTAPDGSAERLRRLDGTHLCPGGAVRMAEPVIQLIADRWNVPVDSGWPNGGWRQAVPFEAAATECPAVD